MRIRNMNRLFKKEDRTRKNLVVPSNPYTLCIGAIIIDVQPKQMVKKVRTWASQIEAKQ